MKKTFVGMLAVATLALTGCGSDDQPEGASPTTSTAPALEVVAMGTPFAVKDKAGATLGNVTVLAAEKNPVCTDRYGTPAKAQGTPVAVQLRVETPADYKEQTFVRTTERDFSEVTSAGVTKDVSIDNDICIADRDEFMNAFTASSKYEGWILLDVSDPASKLIYRPQYSLGGPSYQVVDLATVADGQPTAAPVTPVEPTVAETAPAWTPVETPSVQLAPEPPTGYTGAPIGEPAPLTGKVIDHCMSDPMYQTGTTMFTDGTTGWTQECAG
ncbi:lipoprotein [Rhodococcus phage Whack]|uniref:Lipoprotein n=1 Tax=Rhodococcus phage Whack TaxID=2591132 RepID=A0A515MKE4_9CAUD|nr:lipoprotein [Rhodococcus phage Whack]QDM57099.1 lipoprotein [Rhodococcus phage Whack]